jgi:hypothetical protein
MWSVLWRFRLAIDSKTTMSTFFQNSPLLKHGGTRVENPAELC